MLEINNSVISKERESSHANTISAGGYEPKSNSIYSGGNKNPSINKNHIINPTLNKIHPIKESSKGTFLLPP